MSSGEAKVVKAEPISGETAEVWTQIDPMVLMEHVRGPEWTCQEMIQCTPGHYECLRMQKKRRENTNPTGHAHAHFPPVYGMVRSLYEARVTQATKIWVFLIVGPNLDGNGTNIVPRGRVNGRWHRANLNAVEQMQRHNSPSTTRRNPREEKHARTEHRLTTLPLIGGCANTQIPEETDPQGLLGILEIDAHDNISSQTYLLVSSCIFIISWPRHVKRRRK